MDGQGEIIKVFFLIIVRHRSSAASGYNFVVVYRDLHWIYIMIDWLPIVSEYLPNHEVIVNVSTYMNGHTDISPLKLRSAGSLATVGTNRYNQQNRCKTAIMFYTSILALSAIVMQITF